MNLSSSAKHQRPLRSRQSPELGGSSSTPRSTSGACTPTSPGPAPSAFSSFWGGLVRRFSGESAPKYYETSSERHHRRNGTADAVLTKSSRTRTPSPEGGKLTLPPLPPLELVGFAEDTAPSARLLTVQVAEEIRIMVPARLSIVEQWKLVYSLDQDGASLATLYDKCSRYQGKRVGFVLCVRDAGGGLFGAYLSDYPHPAPKYFGTGECFLWRVAVINSRTNDSDEKPPQPEIRFKAFPYSGVNEYYMLCEAHFLSMGAGDGKYGLWLDDSLERGISSRSQTFGNEPLSDEGEKFDVLGVEVWVIGG